MRLVSIVTTAIEEKILGNAKVRAEWNEAILHRLLAERPDGYRMDLTTAMTVDTDNEKVELTVAADGTLIARPAGSRARRAAQPAA